MLNNTFLRRLYEFQEQPKRVTQRRLRTMSLEWNIPFKIWGTTLDGERYEGREVFSFNGPSRSPGVGYNYNAMGYMIFYCMRKGDYRTFVYSNITAIEKDGVKYEVI